MLDAAIIWEWLEFAVRWLHVITAIAWIGSSFYFIALDLGLKDPGDLPAGVSGEEWQVHGGGFYHVQKYNVAPERLPEQLIWFKWESYSTWLSGAALLMIVYWAGAEFYLVDRSKADLSTVQAIAVSGASLAIGWLVYDRLCKSGLSGRPGKLMVLLFIMLVAMAWGYDQVFTGRAALLHLGAFTATIMTANVFLVIIPNQKIVVSDMRSGKVPDPEYGRIAKLRSLHNNYLTLPVIFLMLSVHYPLSFATEFNWLISSLVFLMGVTIRHYFNTMHAGKGHPHWTWAATAVIFVCIMWLSTAPMFRMSADAAPVTGSRYAAFIEHPGYEQVRSIVATRCTGCHAKVPFWNRVHWPPKGVAFDTDDEIVRAARMIYVQSAVTDAMPPANVTFMELEERDTIARWYREATATR